MRFGLHLRSNLDTESISGMILSGLEIAARMGKDLWIDPYETQTTQSQQL